MNNFITALYQLYPNIVRTLGDDAFDVDNNLVIYDIALVQSQEVLEIKKQEALAYLASTDFKMTADYDQDTTEVKLLRANAREVIRGTK
jgi:hypothetical protein